MNCECKQCRRACKTRPGWFAAGEAEHAAQSLGRTLAAFAEQFLVWEEVTLTNPPERWQIRSPATTTEQAGTVRAPDHRGTCVFYRNGKCAIHTTKPAECRAIDHRTTADMQRELKQAIAATWRIEHPWMHSGR